MTNRVTSRPRTGIKPGKPRTITGRVARKMVDALLSTLRPNDADFEYILMLGAAQASQQALDPSDFDNDQGVDAFAAIFTSITKEPDTIYVTAEWRRVVISARRLMPQREAGERFWSWKKTTEEAKAVHVVALPLFPLGPLPSSS